MADGEGGAIRELISFEIGGQAFCLDVHAVREIRGWTAVTPLPQAPDYVCGVINLRGQVMSVIDLKRRLGMGATEGSSRNVIVVVEMGARVAGLVVDEVQETFQVSQAELQPPPDVLDPGVAAFIDAIIPVQGRLISRLVVDALLPGEALAAA